MVGELQLDFGSQVPGCRGAVQRRDESQERSCGDEDDGSSADVGR